jgi:methylthioribose-1-phosphate isomerase
MQVDASDASLSDTLGVLKATRPTAVNLAWALNLIRNELATLPTNARADAAWRLAVRLADEDAATNEAIGNHGLSVIRSLYEKLQRPVNILTHCNAGWLATVDWGTALACIYKSFGAGIPLHVYVDETRPRNQGLLTAWELRGHGVPHTYIVDNAGGHLMQHGKVDMVVVGADRVSTRGDVANKIGTYLKALAAHDNGIPFYAALPNSTIDPALNDALKEIEIEERSDLEVRQVQGLPVDAGIVSTTDDKLKQHSGLQVENARKASPVLVLDHGSRVSNPGFDVTPARLVTGIVTERGVFAPSQLVASLS